MTLVLVVSTMTFFFATEVHFVNILFLTLLEIWPAVPTPHPPPPPKKNCYALIQGSCTRMQDLAEQGCWFKQCVMQRRTFRARKEKKLDSLEVLCYWTPYIKKKKRGAGCEEDSLWELKVLPLGWMSGSCLISVWSYFKKSESFISHIF